MPIDPSMEPMLDTFIYETTTLLDQLDQRGTTLLEEVRTDE